MNMSSDLTFDQRYKNLNKEQKLAVDTIEGPVMVIAGPGTGKTTILTLRIAEILRKTQTPPNGILAITYTNAGVKAMRDKLREIIGNRAHDVCIYTFHSFASAMISEYPDHFFSQSHLRQMTDVEQESIVRSIISESEFAPLRPLGRPDAYVSSIVRAISDSKKDALTPDLVEKHVLTEIKKVKSDEENISTRGATKGKLKAEALDRLEKLDKTILLSKVYKKYEEVKQKSKLRDYDDLIIELLVALRVDELFLRLIQERFLYILVDEHQDTNDAQNFIVGLIAEFFETPNVFIVGDDKQAIYRFQGASVENFLRLRKLWPDMKVISLDKNYRSHQSILDATFAMIENNYGKNEHADLRKELLSGNENKKRPLDLISTENSLAMEQYMISEIQKIIKKEPNATIALITRRNRELERVLRLLESYEIPVSSERSVDIFHHPVGSIFFDLIEYLVDQTRVDALSRTVALGMWGLSYKQSLEVVHSLRTKSTDIASYLPELIKIRKTMLSDGAVSAVVSVAEDSGFTALVSRDPAYVHVWRGIVTLCESISRDGGIESPLELFRALLTYRESAELKPVKVSVGAPDLSIKVMTAHGSKGLEFDYVFVPYATEEAWVGRAWGSSFALPEKNSSNHDIRDTRRLFYVALTRARKHVTILYQDEESDGKTMTPLRFISELEAKSVKLKRLPRSLFVLEPQSKKIFAVDEYSELMTNQTKKVLLESGLSVTALNHFLECPNKFLYESILKLPQAPNISAEKGIAMHTAISKIWNTKDRNKKKIEEIIIDITKENIDGSLLSLGDKEALKKELSIDAPVVAKALESHFVFSGKVSSESWVETPFDTTSENKTVTVPIHGKLDVVLDSGDTLSVFDYKTKQGMTASAIKKNDNGNYFRQLVFYRILLQNNSKGFNKKIDTSLVFVSPDDAGRCPVITMPVLDEDIKKVKEEIEDLIQTVWSGNLAGKYCTDPSCKYCGYRRLLK